MSPSASPSVSPSVTPSASQSASESPSPSPSIASGNGICWGEENPDPGEEAKSWQYWEVTAGVKVTVDGDADWGKCSIPLYDIVRGDVVDLGSAESRTFTATVNKYGTGDTPLVHVRGSATSFARFDESPSWSTLPTVQAWRYVQLRMVNQ